MVDHEVEDTLREIRERVRASAPTHAPAPLAVVEPGAADSATNPGAGGGSFEALARMEANLATTERTWSRLPPLLSYRRGALARFELAVKRLVKRALHWFTWEQVNFNSAAHHALRDALAALSAHERRLAEARAEADALRRRADAAEAAAASAEAAAAAERTRLEALANSRLEELRAELHRARADLRAELERLRAELPPLREELHDRLREGLGGELREGLGGELREELGGELRERLRHLSDEQRVCFRQLSLEATEAAVAHDRARRLIEARLERIEKQVTGDG